MQLFLGNIILGKVKLNKIYNEKKNDNDEKIFALLDNSNRFFYLFIIIFIMIIFVIIIIS